MSMVWLYFEAIEDGEVEKISLCIAKEHILLENKDGDYNLYIVNSCKYPSFYYLSEKQWKRLCSGLSSTDNASRIDAITDDVLFKEVS